MLLWSNIMVSGIVCYWEFVKEGRRADWKLLASFEIDSEGRCKLRGEPDDISHNEYLYDKLIHDDDPNDYEWVPKPGRVATIWTIGGGVRLLRFIPPEWSSWLSPDFFKKLCSTRNWEQLLDGGYKLYFGTIEEVYKHSEKSDAKQ